MYLSRISLDLANRNTLRALRSPSIFHGAIDSSFDGDRPRNLWRIDRFAGGLSVLLLSSDAPDLSSFCRQFGFENGAQTKSYDAFLAGISADETFTFRLTANPTYSLHDKDDKRGRVCAHTTIGHQTTWLMKQAEKHGFAINSDSFDVVRNEWLRFRKAGSRPVSILSVTYEGTLTVTDPELFRTALTNGIGRGKAYGQGLMTIMRLRRSCDG